MVRLFMQSATNVGNEPRAEVAHLRFTPFFQTSERLYAAVQPETCRYA